MNVNRKGNPKKCHGMDYSKEKSIDIEEIHNKEKEKQIPRIQVCSSMQLNSLGLFFVSKSSMQRYP